MALSKQARSIVTILWGDWQSNELWQRIVKYSVGSTAAMVIAILPATVGVIGPNTFLIPMTTVFAHPAQRTGLMIESLLMVLLGALMGLSWSILGLWLASLVLETSQSSAYTIRGVFLLVVVLVHGFIRSSSPRLFVFVWFMLVASILTLLSKADDVSKATFTNIYYPFLVGGGVLFPANLLLFPELSSSFLGSSTMGTLDEVMDTLNRATDWFITPGGDGEAAMELRATRTRRSAATVRSDTTLDRRHHDRVRKKKSSFWRDLVAEFPNPLKTSKPPSRANMAPLSSTTLANLTGRKPKLRAQAARCKAAQDEVNFEITVSPLSPVALRPITTHGVASLVQNTITVIGACENKFLVLENNAQSIHEHTEKTSDGQPQRSASSQSAARPLRRKYGQGSTDTPASKVDGVKPVKELASGNVKLLESIAARIREPVEDLQQSMQEAVSLLASCLAYSYDVAALPSGAPAPTGISLQEIDLRIDSFTDSLSFFDVNSAEELRKAALDETGSSLDMMPRMETLLLSSFLLAFRQAADHILHMLRHARDLVVERQQRHEKSRIWFPHYISLRSWLLSGGESYGLGWSEAVWKSVLRQNKSGKAAVADDDAGNSCHDDRPLAPVDEEATGSPTARVEKSKSTTKNAGSPARPGGRGWLATLREVAADALESVQDSDNLAYSIKLAVAIFLVSWPALVGSWNTWYANVHGKWAPMQLTLVFEVAIGASFFTIAIRLVGVVYGCVMGYLAYEIGQGHRAAIVVVYVCGLIPAVYIHVATKYVKAGMISIVSMSVVTLSSVFQSSEAYEIFYKRLAAFMIGSVVAILVEVFVYPVRARDRLVESLSTSVRLVQGMQAAVAIGIDGPDKPDFRSQALLTRFTRARNKAQGALGAAESFLPFCLTEPRLKGSFKALAPVYREVIYVLHQIIDRMDNVVQLRKAYGSSILEDLNPQVFTYRRNAMAGIILMLFSVNEALLTWLPLPQFIPSARLAQLRLINRVREVLNSRPDQSTVTGVSRDAIEAGEVDERTAEIITQRRFLSWNASTAGQMELIEYVEELVELVKLLVGVNAFRSGILEKPTYREYAQQVVRSKKGLERIRSTRAVASTLMHDDAGEQEEAGSASFAATVALAQRVRRFGKKARKGVAAGDEQENGLESVQEGDESDDGEDSGSTEDAGGYYDEQVHAEGQRDGEGENEGVDEDEDEDEDDVIPASLQRVGTRLAEADMAVRRRRFNVED